MKTKEDKIDKRLNKLEKNTKSSKPVIIRHKIGIKKTILVSAFLGFIFGLLMFMWTSEISDIFHLKVAITIWIGVWMFILVGRFEKGSMLEFGAAIARIGMESRLTDTDKLGLIMGMVQDAANVAANLSLKINVDEKMDEIEKLKKKIE